MVDFKLRAEEQALVDDLCRFVDDEVMPLQAKLRDASRPARVIMCRNCRNIYL